MAGAYRDSLSAAIRDYRARGWSVVPIAPSEKKPLVPWKEYQDRKPDDAEVAGWLEKWPKANLAVVTGAASGLVVLDIDPKHGGEAQLAALERLYGALPKTVEAATGGGGRHIYFRHPGTTIHNKTGIRDGIDLRGDGGIVIVPPSIHPSGKPYRWKRGCSPDEAPLAEMPTWLRQVVRGDQTGAGHPPGYWRDLVRTGVGEGARNNTIASFAGHLFHHGIDPEVATELLLCWNEQRCRPPLPAAEVARTVESIARLNAGES